LRHSWRILLAAAIGLTVFVADTFTDFKGALSVLYTASIVLVAQKGGYRRLIAVGAACAGAAAFSFLREHWGEPLDDAWGRFGVALVAIAITTLLLVLSKAAEGRERAADARYKSIFNAGGFAIWETDWSGVLAVLRSVEAEAGDDLEGWLLEHPQWVRWAGGAARVVAINDEAVRLFGLDGPEAVIGRNLGRFYTRPAETVLARAFAAFMRGERVVEVEVQIRRSSGEVVDLVQRITRPEADAPWRRVLIMAIDVTARNEAQAKLDAAVADLAHVSRVTTLGQLAASIVHEVNQPLAAVVAYGRSGLRWLAREAPDARETADCLDGVVANAGRAADVIARVRDLARKTTPATEAIELRSLIDDTLALLQREVQDRGVMIRRQAPPEPAVIMGDRVQIQQVLMNLVLNAAQAMEQSGAPRREIAIVVTRDDRMVNVSVRDSGGGFVAVDAERVFDPFVSTKAQGLGIGLSICRSIVEGHGGRIRAANAAGGAEVTFSLPAAAALEGRVA
jgi:PAS domain S-box-containing protein